MSPAKQSKSTVGLGEWKLASIEDFRTGLASMMRFRRMNQDDLGWKMGNGERRRNLFSAFLNGKQADVKMSSFLDAMDAMDLEVVVRRRTDKAERARAALRAERGRDAERVLAEQAMAENEAQGRDEAGRLKFLTPEVKAEVEATLDKYGSFA